MSLLRIGPEKVLQVRCSFPLWKALGWQGHDKHPIECSPEPEPLRFTALVETPWAYERQPLKFQLICGE